MAATLQYNITTVLTQEILSVGDNVSNAKYISVANVDLNKTAIINFFLNKGANNYYLIKNYYLPAGQTLVLNKDDNIAFNNTTNGFSLRVQVEDFRGAAAPVDIIITK